MCEHPYRYVADKPCDTYFGNVCGGFGGETICWHCGWNLIDHHDEDYTITIGDRS